MIRIAFLGAGGIARTHARQLNTVEGCAIAAACAATLEEAEAFARDCAPNAKAFSDFDAMLDEGGIDALWVCLPPFAHNGQEEKAAARGIPLFLEKPIALDLARAESIVAACEKAGITTHVGFHMRFTAPVRKLKAMVDEGTAGQGMLLSADYLCNALHAPWWRRDDLSGGQLVEQAIHLYDLSCHLLGEPVSVSAAIDRLGHQDLPDYTVEDVSAATIRFASGAIGSIRASNCSVPMQWRSPWKVVFANLCAESDGGGEATLWRTEGKTSEHFWSTGQELPQEAIGPGPDPYREQAAAFLDAVRAKTPAPTPARVGLERLKLVLAAKRSAREGGRPVLLSEMNAHA